MAAGKKTDKIKECFLRLKNGTPTASAKARSRKLEIN